MRGIDHNDMRICEALMRSESPNESVHPETEQGGTKTLSKAEKIAQEREKVIQSIAACQLDTVLTRIAWILNHHPETRNSDIALQLKYWKYFDSDIYSGYAIRPEDLY